jgi:alginate O-acetyltransferase complex protein AlgI
MVVLILAGLYAMKAVVVIESRDAGVRLGPLAWLSFAALWFGMRPAPFTALGGPARSGSRELALHGARMLVLGVGLVLSARVAWSAPVGAALEPVRLVAATAIALLGLSLHLHFGIFNLVTALWRRLGVEVRPLFREPLRSRSLTEFWGRRWNLAFSEMTSLGVYRPLARATTAEVALVAAFVFSGLLHELAISLPVRSGFGLPMLYFLLHALLMTIERALAAMRHPIEAIPWLGRAWTIAWLLAPLPILFHPPFLAGIVWPLLAP